MMPRCDLCGSPHQMGPNRFNGEFLSHYRMQVCNSCLGGHVNGIPRAFELRFVAHLEKHGIALPERNKRGLYSLDATP